MGERLPEPTSAQCSANETVDLGHGRSAVAAWYPQMGGYVGKALIVVPDGDGCFEVYVWHDGDFPFHDGEPPRELHHCDPEQFIAFGELCKRLAGEVHGDG